MRFIFFINLLFSLIHGVVIIYGEGVVTGNVRVENFLPHFRLKGNLLGPLLIALNVRTVGHTFSNC